MMHPTLKQLFAMARQEQPPLVDLADSVLRSLSGQELRGAGQPVKLMLWVGVAATGMAVLLLLVALPARYSGDVVQDILNIVRWAG